MGKKLDDAVAVAGAALSSALHARAHGQQADWARSVAALADGRFTAADSVLLGGLRDRVSAVWARGWQPADVLCAAGRVVGAQTQRLLIDMIAAELRQHATATVDQTWERQLSSMEAAVWWERDESYFALFAARWSLSRVDTVAVAVDALYFLGTLPRLPLLCPPPGQARRGSLANPSGGADQRMLERVRALLAKAEATNFPEEAETYTAKAQELMTRHSIDYAKLGAPKTGKQQPTGRRIPIHNPYDSSRATLLSVIAAANRCTAVWSKEFGFSTIVGFAADADATEILFTSLLLQASTALQLAGSTKQTRTVSFRRSFLAAFASRIGQRLELANRSVMDSVSKDYGGQLLPVLAGRAEAVKETFDEMFPSVTFRSASAATNPQGWVAGLAAADRAKLGGHAELAQKS